ncbi:MAG TPA: Rrf2 family transcriptional regulator [Gemmatimonadota bacterium]|nr:Rrf2 family transcriptional regulator [Gemmatimonadota bacterium]
MTISSRFAVAVHILTLLETGRGEPLTSEYMAGSVNTNPAVVRRILSMLARAGITVSRLGAGGGTMLARSAADITLKDIYRAVECQEHLFALHHEKPNPKCPIGRNIQAVLERATGAAQSALEEELGERTVADVMAEVWAEDREARSATI